jgi:hypothetical protein
MTPFIAAVLALIIGLALVLRGRIYRSSRGLGQGRTVALDNRTLYSRRVPFYRRIVGTQLNN